MACLNTLPHIAHDMHAQYLHCSQLDITRQLLEVGQVLYRLQLLAWHPLHSVIHLSGHLPSPWGQVHIALSIYLC